MVQLEDNLDKSSQSISKISLQNNSLDEQQQNDESNITDELVKQIEIPIAYTANAEVISVQNSLTKTLLDIKA
jgi:flagellar hook protein FlgE